MTTWQDDEEGAETSQPREGIEIITPATTWRIATGSRDIVIDGQTYRAQPADRGKVGLSFVGETRELEIRLPVSHAFAQRYIAAIVPPRSVLVNVYRKQVTSGSRERIWQGKVTTASVDGHVASFLAPSTSGETITRRLPVLTAGRGCPHVLYDDNCKVPRASFTVTTTVTSHGGAVVTVASVGSIPSAVFGELIHVASGERMTIFAQSGVGDRALTLQFPIHELADGDTVQIAAGCAHDITTCAVTFENQANFGGAPHMPFDNPHIPSSRFGVITQD